MSDNKYLFNSISKIRESLDAMNLYDKSIAELTEVQLGLNKLDYINSIHSAMNRIDYLSNSIALREAAAFSEVNNFSKSVMEVLSAGNLFDKSVTELAEAGLGIDRLGLHDSIRFAMSGIDSNNGSNTLREITALAKNDSISKGIMESLNAKNLYGKSIAELVDERLGLNRLGFNSAAQSAMEHINSMSATNALRNTITSTSAIQNAIGLLAKPDNFSTLIDSIALQDKIETDYFSFEEEYFDDDKVEHQLKEVAETRDLKAFTEAFGNLPNWLQFVMIYLVLELLVPTYYEHFLKCKMPLVDCPVIEQSNRESIKKLKNSSSINPDFGDYRFISKNSLTLHEKPKLKSRANDTLHFGQTVNVIDKQKNWIEIAYLDANNEIKYGWILSRYTVKFLRAPDQVI